MKEKIPVILSVLSFLLLGFCFIFISSLVDSHKTALRELALLDSEKKQFAEDSKAQKSEAASKLTREKNRREELSSKMATLESDLSSKERALLEEKESIAGLEKQIQAKEAIVLDAADAEKQSDLKMEEARLKAAELAGEIPRLENQLWTIKQDKETAGARIIKVSDKLSDYDSITAQIRIHHTNVLKGIREYSRERPWIEPGDTLSTSFHSLDLGTGTIGLPLGSDAGIQEGMLFSVTSRKHVICKIKIKEVDSRKSLGFIIPLFGNPQKLRKVEKIDLVSL